MNAKSTKTIVKPANKRTREVRPVLQAMTEAPHVAMVKTKKKTVVGRFSMPQSDFALIAQLKSTFKRNGRSVKKNELIRAGLRVLSALPEEELLSIAMIPAKPVRKTP